MTSEKTQKPQDYAGATQNPKADGKTAHADVDGVVSIHIERLRRPEHQDGEEVAAGDESDDQRQAQGARLLLQSRWEDRVASAVDLPEAERDENDKPENEGGENVSGCPFVLFHRSQKQILVDCCWPWRT